MRASAARGYVVDASVALKWYVEEEDSDVAARLIETGADLHAPAHWAAEMANALWVRGRARAEPRLPPPIALRILNEIARGGVRTLEVAPLLEDAWSIATTCDVTVYDALYVAAAERLDLPFVTADERLIRRLRGAPWAERCLSLGDLEAS